MDLPDFAGLNHSILQADCRRATIVVAEHVDDAGRLDRQQKSALNTTLNGAFKAWFHLLTGNAHFGRAILRHGFTSPTALTNLLTAYQRYIDSDEHIERLKNEAAAEGGRALLRREAITARQDLKRSQYLQRRIEAGKMNKERMSKADWTLVVLLRQGVLDRRRAAANTAYGYGGGAPATCLSIESIMTNNHSFRPLERYFAS